MTATRVKGTAMLTFALIYFTFVIQHSSTLELITNHPIIENPKQLVFTEEFMNGQYLAYAICRNSHNELSNSQCQVFLKTVSGYGRSCFVSVENGYVGEGARLIPLSADRIVIVGTLSELHSDVIYSFEHFSTLTMDNCKIVEHKRSQGYFEFTYSLTPLDGKRYDVVAMDKSKSFCRWEFDTEKKSVSEPFDCLLGNLTENNNEIQPLRKDSPREGYIVTNGENEHWIKVNNKMILTKFLPPLGGDEVVTSTANSKISICSTNNRSTTCYQYDRSGQVVNHIFISHDVEFGGGSAVHNLKTGGSVIATGICEDGCLNGDRIPTYYVKKYDEKGRRKRVSIIRDFKCDLKHYKVALKFYDNGRGMVCLSMACYGSVARATPVFPHIWEPKLDVTVECFD